VARLPGVTGGKLRLDLTEADYLTGNDFIASSYSLETSTKANSHKWLAYSRYHLPAHSDDLVLPFSSFFPEFFPPKVDDRPVACCYQTWILLLKLPAGRWSVY